MALFQDLNKQGKTIVFVTHEDDIAAFSSRTLEFRDGNVISNNVNRNILSAQKELDALPKKE